jgi:hypothetical protein
LATLLPFPVHLNRCSQIIADQVQYSLVPFVQPYPVYQQVVVDVIEKGADIQINHPTFPFLEITLCRPHGIVRTASRPKSIAVITETPVHAGAQMLTHCLLDDPVLYAR